MIVFPEKEQRLSDAEIGQVLKRILREESKYLIAMYPAIYRQTIDMMMSPFLTLAKEGKISKIVALESSGWLFGGPISSALSLPLVPVLKQNKIQDRETAATTNSYIDYSGQSKTLELYRSTILPGDQILLVDDWLESGNTCLSVIRLLEKLGAKIQGISAVYNQLQAKTEGFFLEYNFHFLTRLEPNPEMETVFEGTK